MAQTKALHSHLVQQPRKVQSALSLRGSLVPRCPIVVCTVRTWYRYRCLVIYRNFTMTPCHRHRTLSSVADEYQHLCARAVGEVRALAAKEPHVMQCMP